MDFVKLEKHAYKIFQKNDYRPKFNLPALTECVKIQVRATIRVQKTIYTIQITTAKPD